MREVASPIRLPSGQLLPSLRIVETREVRLHEDADPERVTALSARLRDEGVLRNPPLATPLPGSAAALDRSAPGQGAYVVLDGANRTSALQALGFPYHLLQIVDYTQPSVRLEVWHHLLRDDPRIVETLPLGTFRPVEDAAALERGLAGGEFACGLLSEREVLGVISGPAARERLAALRRVVDVYAKREAIYRVATIDLEVLRREYERVGAVVVFPRFSKEQILDLAESPVKLPTGITRHVVPERVLRVNFPLELLRPPGTLVEKNAALHELLHARLLQHRVRYYAEPTFMLDE